MTCTKKKKLAEIASSPHLYSGQQDRALYPTTSLFPVSQDGTSLPQMVMLQSGQGALEQKGHTPDTADGPQLMIISFVKWTYK